MKTQHPALMVGVLLTMTTLVCMTASFSLAGTIEVYLNINNIPGESTARGHENWIDVQSFSWGIGRAISSPGQPGTAAAAFQDLGIAKLLDKASPKLYQACCAGDRLSTMTLSVTRVISGLQPPFPQILEYKFTDVVVTSIKPSGSGSVDALPSEVVVFNFGKIEWTYTRVDPASGNPLDIISGGWDLVNNRPVTPAGNSSASAEVLKMK